MNTPDPGGSNTPRLLASLLAVSDRLTQVLHLHGATRQQIETHPELVEARAAIAAGTGRESLAWSACRQLVAAYREGDRNGGSVDWSDVDDAHELARSALKPIRVKKPTKKSKPT